MGLFFKSSARPVPIPNFTPILGFSRSKPKVIGSLEGARSQDASRALCVIIWSNLAGSLGITAAVSVKEKRPFEDGRTLSFIPLGKSLHVRSQNGVRMEVASSRNAYILTGYMLT